MAERALYTEWRKVARIALPWALVLVPVTFVARATILAVLAKVGFAAPTLDDSYIHYQYARAIAEGHPLRYQAGEPVSTGATSLLYVLLLAPFHLVGFRGAALTWGAWLLGYASWAGLAWETYFVTVKLTGRAAAATAAAMVLAFGGFAWCAASGMEVMPFAWAIFRGVRRASEWSEEPHSRSRRRFVELAALAFALPLLRPEGSLFTLVIAAIVAAFPSEASLRSRARALVPLAAVLVPPLLLYATTRSFTSSTAQVKLLANNPYCSFRAASSENARILVTQILNGEAWSAEFFPKGCSPVLFGGLVATLVVGEARKVRVRAILVVLSAAAIFVTCTYYTFLWNRLRYLWPFATGWFVGVACLARLVSEGLARLDRRMWLAGPILGAIAAGLLASKLEGVVEDVAQSASGIDRQQATLGRWARSELPTNARIGVNDTGAIAYFSDRKTFDIVGLTTQSEGRYWVWGPASRLEHYERLRRDSPERLPSHFIVYPEWFTCDPILGPQLNEAVVTDSTILGGQTMRVFRADYGLLGTGEAPFGAFPNLVDSLDVADADDELAHGYELLGAREREQDCFAGERPGVTALAIDGGRTHRVRERFRVKLPIGKKVIATVRLRADKRAKVSVTLEGRAGEPFELEESTNWEERVFHLPPPRDEESTFELAVSGGYLTTFHYWFATAPE